MRRVLLLLIFAIPVLVFSQVKRPVGNINSNGTVILNDSLNKSQFGESSTLNTTPKAPVDWYKIISINNDTIVMDTTLTIKKEYRSNYLRRDLFGLLPFPNEGQPYNLLDFRLIHFNPYPEMGFKGKHFAYMEIDDIKYYHVPTPMTDLHYKSVMEQGQMLDAFITINTSPKFNFSIAYKGIRSIGKYINSLSSNGNFRFTVSYKSEENRYIGNYHITAQDFENQENGGIVNIEDFESGEKLYTNRTRLDVYFKDATSLLKGDRFFVDHSYRINREKGENNLALSHRFFYENKEYKFTQKTPNERLGDTYILSDIRDFTQYNQ